MAKTAKTKSWDSFRSFYAMSKPWHISMNSIQTWQKFEKSQISKVPPLKITEINKKKRPPNTDSSTRRHGGEILVNDSQALWKRRRNHMFTFLSQIITLKGGRIALQLTPTLISSGPQKDCSPMLKWSLVHKQIPAIPKTIMGRGLVKFPFWEDKFSFAS